MRKTGIELITQERQEQIEKHGWSKEHDAKHDQGELANAACSYAMTSEMQDYLDENWGDDMHLSFWPFELSYYKKDNSGEVEKIKDLAKAGALIAAEIDRLQAEQAQIKKKMENKVTIEITAEGSTTELTLNGKTYIDKWEPTDTGAKAVIQEIEDATDIPDELQDALTSMAQYSIMSAFRMI